MFLRNANQGEILLLELVRRSAKVWNGGAVLQRSPRLGGTTRRMPETTRNGESEELSLRLGEGYIIIRRCLPYLCASWLPDFHGSCALCRTAILFDEIEITFGLLSFSVRWITSTYVCTLRQLPLLALYTGQNFQDFNYATIGWRLVDSNSPRG